jgi:hypothetical protein
MDSQFTGQQRWLRRSGLLMAVWLAACGGIEGDGSRVSPALLAVQVGGGENGGSILPPVEGEFPSLLPGVGANLPQDEPVSGLSSFENESARSFTVSGASTASPMRPRSLAQAVPVSMVSLGTLPAAELQRLEEDSAKPGIDGTQRRLRTGVGRKLSAQSQVSAGGTGAALEWQTLPDGSRAAALGVSTGDARSVRLGLLVDALPPQARLRFFAPGSTQMIELPAEQVLARLEAKRHGSAVRGAGVFWAPAVAGSAAVVEVVLPAGIDVSSVRIDVIEVIHQVLTMNEASAAGLKRVIDEDGNPLSGACQRDVVCSGEVAAEADAALLLDFIEYDNFGRASSYSCSGMLIGDSARTGTPFVLTADHCISNPRLAFDTDAYLFWRATTCGGNTSDERQALFAWGLEYLYSESERTGADMALLRPSNRSFHVPEAGLRLAGWNSSFQSTSQAVTGFHHPMGDHLMRSLGVASPSPRRNYLRVFWSEGTTERGSSGSALLNQSGQVIGTLWGGASACSGTVPNGWPDEYGRFSVAYAKGLRSWLNTATLPLAMVARTGQTDGPAELVFRDARQSSAGRTTYQAVRLDSSAPGALTPAGWRAPAVFQALETGSARVLTVQDIDGDGKDDIVIRRPGLFQTEFISVVQEQGTGVDLQPGEWILHTRLNASTSLLGMGDFDGNGVHDLLLYDARSKLIQLVLLSRSLAGTYLSQLVDLYGLIDELGRPIRTMSPVAVGDFNGTGRAQLLIRDSRFPNDSLFAHWNPDFRLFQLSVGQRALPGTLLATADMNADGRHDFLVNDRGAIRVVLSQGGGSLGETDYAMQPALTAVASMPAGFAYVAMGDVDGDGLPDLVLRHRTTAEIRVARNPGGSGSWTASTVNLVSP